MRKWSERLSGGEANTDLSVQGQSWGMERNEWRTSIDESHTRQQSTGHAWPRGETTHPDRSSPASPCRDFPLPDSAFQRPHRSCLVNSATASSRPEGGHLLTRALIQGLSQEEYAPYASDGCHRVLCRDGTAWGLGGGIGGGAGSVVDSEENDSDRELKPERISDFPDRRCTSRRGEFTRSCPPINLFVAC